MKTADAPMNARGKSGPRDIYRRERSRAEDRTGVRSLPDRTVPTWSPRRHPEPEPRYDAASRVCSRHARA